MDNHCSLVLRRYRKKWAQISNEMNNDFWAKTDDDVKQYYFSSTASADDDWTKKFFMDDADKEATDKGQYMPLGGAGGGNSGGADGEDEDEMMKQMSAEYGMTNSGGEADNYDQAFQEQWKDTTSNEKWQNMVNRINKPFAKSKIRAVDKDDDGDDVRPLYEDGSYREVL